MYSLIVTILAFAATGAAGDANSPRAGGSVSNISASEQAYFADGAARFAAIDSVQGTEPGASDVGLGPRFNSNGCASCHAYPAVEGSSPAVNPQIAVATRYGAHNTIPSFVQRNGPVREARFKAYADGSPDGGVHDLFVITGRYDAPQQCAITQPD